MTRITKKWVVFRFFLQGTSRYSSKHFRSHRFLQRVLSMETAVSRCTSPGNNFHNPNHSSHLIIWRSMRLDGCPNNCKARKPRDHNLPILVERRLRLGPYSMCTDPKIQAVGQTLFFGFTPIGFTLLLSWRLSTAGFVPPPIFYLLKFCSCGITEGPKNMPRGVLSSSRIFTFLLFLCYNTMSRDSLSSMASAWTLFLLQTAATVR